MYYISWDEGPFEDGAPFKGWAPFEHVEVETR